MVIAHAAPMRMQRESRAMAYVVPSILCAVGLALLAVAAWQWLHDPPRRLCPGTRLRWPQRLSPLWLALRMPCGYDLSGHSLDRRGGLIVCPECGRSITRRRQMIRSARRWRPLALGAVCLLAAPLVYWQPPLAATTVVQHIPTEALLRGEGTLGTMTPLEMRDEIRRRAFDSELDQDQVCRFVQLLVNDLRDDVLLGNATDALDRLCDVGLLCPEPVIAALDSDDLQQKRMAKRLLKNVFFDRPPPASLLRACVEDLRSDDRMGNAAGGFRFLLRHGEFLAPVLREGLRSDDAQQRLLCAVLAGCTNNTALMEQAVPVLVHHLADNRITGDAVVAARALWGFGPDVLPLLEPYCTSSDDAQQRQQCEYIIRRRTTDHSLVQLQLELPLARLSYGGADALELDPRWMRLPWIAEKK